MNRKLRGKGKAFLIHLSAAIITATGCWILISKWYPTPYFEILHGQEILTLAIAIDLFLGPVVTFLLFNPQGSKRELLTTTTIAVLLQLSALSYGLYEAASSRPIFLAFEGDKFRIVSRPDIKTSELSEAPEAFKNLSIFGVKTIGVKLLESGDSGFLESIQLDLQGIHPAYRPQRWRSYVEVKLQVLKRARTIEAGRYKKIETKEEYKKEEGPIFAIPIVAYDNKTYWAAVVDPKTADIVGFLELK